MTFKKTAKVSKCVDLIPVEIILEGLLQEASNGCLKKRFKIVNQQSG